MNKRKLHISQSPIPNFTRIPDVLYRVILSYMGDVVVLTISGHRVLTRYGFTKYGHVFLPVIEKLWFLNDSKQIISYDTPKKKKIKIAIKI